MAEIAVVDDEELMRDLISSSLKPLGHKVKCWSDPQKMYSEFIPGQYDLVVSDYKMPGMNGIELAEKLLAKDKLLPIILMTAYGSVENAVKAMKLGVQDFVEKPFQVEILEHAVLKALQLGGLKKENTRLRSQIAQKYVYIGESKAVKDLLEVVNSIAESNSTVLVTGESGTGKELIAHAIHFKSKRNDLPFVKINCAAIPENLIESELFGHEKGAYTGAVRTRQGKFELADGGTLLLDEIGEMPLYAQSKLLRVLQEKEVTKIGGDEEIPVDVRIICTTNRDLQKEVESGNFREDLFYRLNVIPLRIPPLRERISDIPLLAGHFIGRYNKENGYQVEGVSGTALESLQSHSWPGNVRELENVIQRAVVFAKNGLVQNQHLNLTRAKETFVMNSGLFKTGMSVAEAEKKLILQTLRECDDNRTRAAEILDISIRTLRNKLHEYRLTDQETE